MKQALLDRLTPYGQQHLLACWDELDEPERKQLAQQIEALDLSLIERLYRHQGSQTDWAALAGRAEPPPAVRLGERGRRFPADEARARGREALARGEVGAILVAGGQGTRLGFNRPKGMYPVGPVSGATLFQILMEKVLAASRSYGVPVPLYLMTSPATHEETLVYLEENRRFGLAASDVHVFCQGTMPAVDAGTGKLLLSSPGQLALSPDGHGGMLAALARCGGLADFERRGVRHLFYFQVDNPLAPVCDPEFLGYHLLSGSQLSTLAVAKQRPQERVGNIVSVDGKVQIIEYSDLPEQAAARRGADGALRLWAGNTAIHIFQTAFLAEAAGREESLPFHVARKTVPYLDEAGRVVEPAEPNALKFERFIFDLLPAARHALVVEAEAASAFAPLKNASGAAADSPETVNAALVALARRWLQEAGAEVVDGVALEISPLLALDCQELAAKIEKNLRITQPRYFC